MISDRRVIEALDDFIQKAGYNETLGHWDGNTARAQIKKFVFVDLTGRCAVGATAVVGENFQAGRRSRFPKTL
jgi:hypothetical protein